MRARNIKPTLFTNELLAIADPLYTVIFAGLWCLADREGRIEDRPVRIHMAINPGRPFDGTEKALGWLAEQGFIARYRSGSVAVIQVVKFAQHQNPHHREKASDLPPMDGGQASGVDSIYKHSALGQPTIDDGSASGQPRASPGPAPDIPPCNGEKPETSPGLVAEIPERARLIPDSGFLIPDSSPCGGEGAAAPPAPPGNGKNGKKPKRGSLAHFVPESWTLDRADYDWAIGQGYSAETIQRETERFADHEFHAPRSDWARAWRNWISRDPPGGRHGTPHKRTA